MAARTAASLVLVTVVLLASAFVSAAVGMDLTPDILVNGRRMLTWVSATTAVAPDGNR